jgi:periplasmic divalent cation tolerance protein
MTAGDLRILFVTSSSDHAPELVRTLVDERLVACGNIMPGVLSVYRWEGETCQEQESVILMETTTDRVQAATARISQLHRHDIPKIVVLDPESANPPYMEWVRTQTRSEPKAN